MFVNLGGDRISIDADLLNKPSYSVQNPVEEFEGDFTVVDPGDDPFFETPSPV